MGKMFRDIFPRKIFYSNLFFVFVSIFSVAFIFPTHKAKQGRGWRAFSFMEHSKYANLIRETFLFGKADFYETMKLQRRDSIAKLKTRKVS